MGNPVDTERSSDSSSLPIDSPGVDGSLPTPEEVKGTLEIGAAGEDDYSDANNRNRRKQGSSVPWLFAVGCGVCFLLLIAVVIPLALRKDDGQRNEVGVNVGEVSAEPQAKYTEVVDFLTSSGISDEDAFYGQTSETVVTPQAKAAKWIAEEDELYLSVPSGTGQRRRRLDEQKEYDDYIVRYVLAVMYYSLNGDSWQPSFKFLQPKHICEWKEVRQVAPGLISTRGVVCDSSNTMIELFITSNKASGELPKEVRHLSTLKGFSVVINNIGGTIPTEICELTGLETLAIGENKFVGGVPDCIGSQLSALKGLDAINLQLEGEFPETVCNLKNLTVLVLQGNKFTGPVPTNCFSEWDSLTSLRLGNNELSGEIPWSNLCQHRNLQYLWLQNSKFNGTIDNCISKWNGMKSMVLSNNFFEGPFPSIAYTDMDELMIDRNLFTGDIINALHELEVHLIYASDNNFTGNMKEFAFSTNLTALDLSHNGITSEGGVSSELLASPYLQLLDLSHNDIVGPIEEAENVTTTALRWLSLNDNKLNGEIPAKFIDQLDETVAYFNLFTGTVYLGLEHLDLSNNEFSGTMPSEIGNHLRELRYLFLANNPQLDAGPVPESFENLRGLTELSLKNTNRNGPLPDFIGELNDLVLLDVDDNKFIGEVPETWSSLVRLQYLLINRNPGLNGTVPASFSHLTALSSFYLDATNIEGSINGLCSNIPAFQGDELPTGGDQVVDVSRMIADCDSIDGGGSNDVVRVACSCCLCCDSVPLDENSEGCSRPIAASLDLAWYENYRRVQNEPLDFEVNFESFQEQTTE